MTRSGAQIRQEFIDFFRAKQHDFVPSSPVVPYDDPTLLFTNAGMNQFKPIFLGAADPKSEFGRLKRAVNSQKCIRAGGKHNDLDDVGHDTYHHTFFEMLGNWSFGDYFKKEAIEWAWELLTDVWGLDKSRLHATYFEGDAKEGLEPDLEAKELWASVTDIDPTHIHPGGKKDNFWEMGETGPCGPCSEIHIDLTPDKSGRELVNAGDARVMEIWNLVFIQFNRAADGKLTPLPAKHVDTGLGLERVTALIQGKTSNYDTDLFTPIFDAIRKVTGAPPYGGTLPHAVPVAPVSNRCENGEQNEGHRLITGATHQVMVDISYRVIADHIRCLTFALTDGAIPDRDGRGYVLRRILRRAVRYGWQYLNMHEPFLHKLVPAMVDTMGDAFPELREKPQRVINMIRDEEESFDRTLERGIRLFDDAVVRAFVRSASEHQMSLGPQRCLIEIETRTFRHTLPSRNAADFHVDASTQFTVYKIPQQTLDSFVGSEILSKHVSQYCGEPPVISGDDAFKLHDTYGFPIDLTQIMGEEKGLRVDIGGYDRLMEEAREAARGCKGPDGDADRENITKVGDRANEALSKPEEVRRLEEAYGEPASITRDLDDPFEPETYRRLAEGRSCDDSLKYVHPFECDALVSAMARSSELFGSDKATQGQVVFFSTNRTVFYAEQGGQVSDTGILQTEDGATVEIDAVSVNGVHVSHRGTVRSGEFSIGVTCRLRVDRDRRDRIMKNHTATHVLNWALREVLCPPEEREQPHLQQRGSLVDPNKTRFDFSHNNAVSPDELERIETLCNQRIADDLQVFTAEVDQKAAREIDTLRAVFGEKYPDEVRVVSIGVPITEEEAAKEGRPDWLLKSPQSPEWKDYSVEFCGGTHVKRTGEIERFVLTTEEAVGKGIRRVVGITGDKAREAEARGRELLARADALLVSDTSPERQRAGQDADEPFDLPATVAQLQKDAAEAVIPLRDRAALRDRIAELQKLVKQQKKADAADATDVVMQKIAALLESAEKIGDTTVVVAEMPNLPLDQLKSGADAIKQKCGSAAVLFGVHAGEKALLLAAMSNDLIKKGLKAGDLVKHLAPIVKGGGGGPPTMAQAGGKDPSKIGEALKAGRAWIAEKL